MNFYDIKNRKEEKMTEVVRTKSGKIGRASCRERV